MNVKNDQTDDETDETKTLISPFPMIKHKSSSLKILVFLTNIDSHLCLGRYMSCIVIRACKRN